MFSLKLILLGWTAVLHNGFSEEKLSREFQTPNIEEFEKVMEEKIMLKYEKL